MRPRTFTYGPALPKGWPLATLSRDVISSRRTCAAAGAAANRRSAAQAGRTIAFRNCTSALLPGRATRDGAAQGSLRQPKRGHLLRPGDSRPKRKQEKERRENL